MSSVFQTPQVLFELAGPSQEKLVLLLVEGLATIHPMQALLVAVLQMDV
jgi:hypothetical protein